jgi:hypothetical protein
MKVAPSRRLFWWAGVNPYPGPARGPVATWICRPLPIPGPWPATFASDVATASMTAVIFNLLLAIGALGAPAWSHTPPGTSGPALIWSLLFALAGRTAVNLVFHHADNIVTSSKAMRVASFLPTPNSIHLANGYCPYGHRLRLRRKRAEVAYCPA